MHIHYVLCLRSLKQPGSREQPHCAGLARGTEILQGWQVLYAADMGRSFQNCALDPGTGGALPGSGGETIENTMANHCDVHVVSFCVSV